MADTPTAEPLSFRVGDTVRWTRSLADYPADAGWQLVYTYVSVASKQVVTATAAGALHSIEITAAGSALWAAGDYTWQATVSKGAERYTIGVGRTVVLVNIAVAAGGLDTSTHARRVLAAVEAVLEGRAGEAEADVQINGRAVKYIPIAELLVLRDRYRAEVAREDAAVRLANGLGGSINTLRVRF